MSGNKTLYLDHSGQVPCRIGDSEIYTPGTGEVLIKNHALGINPVDWMVQGTGSYVQNWPYVLGCDVAGEVEAVGANVSHVKKGDHVLAHCVTLMQQEPKYGGFQHYSVTPGALTAKIPTNMAYKDAVVLPLAIDTAAHGMYDQAPFLGLPYASLSPKDSGKTILLWGGSSSVGASVLQLARASGVKVVTTASKRNFDFCKDAGAVEVVDYNSATVVDDVVAAVQKAGGTFAGVYDAISKQDGSYKHVLPILEKLGGNVNLACVLPPPEEDQLPRGVKTGNVFAINERTHKMWAEFVSPALENGMLRPLPPAEVVGKGLDSVQKGVDMNKAGVSAKKVVIEL